MDLVQAAYNRRRKYLSHALPEDIANGQAADEMRRSAVRALQAGAFVSEICEHAGLPPKSIFKALEIVAKKKATPIEAYFEGHEEWSAPILRRQLTLKDRIEKKKRGAAIFVGLRSCDKTTRERVVLAARALGLTYKQIGEALGISGGRVQQIAWTAERDEAKVQKFAASIAKYAHKGDD